MSVRQLPDGQWAYRFNYAKHPYRKQCFRNRSEAEKAETLKKSDLLRRQGSGESLQDDLRIGDAADLFFEEYSRPHKRTWKMDRTHTAAIKEFFRNRKIRDISPRDVEAFRLWIHKTGRGLTSPRRTLHTVNHYHSTLKAIVNWVKKKRLYSGDNPAWGVAMARVEKARVRWLTPEEEKRLTPVVAKHSRLWPYYVIGLHTGMRLGEIWEIRVRDFNPLPTPMLFVPHTKTRWSRYVPLHGPALEIVRELVKGRPDDQRLLDAVHKSTVSGWFNDCCREAEVPDFTFHCLRHTFTAWMLSRGVPIYKVSKMLGHTTSATTEQHYGHLDRREFSAEIHHIDGVIKLPDPAISMGLEARNDGEVVNEVVNGDGNAATENRLSS